MPRNLATVCNDDNKHDSLTPIFVKAQFDHACALSASLNRCEEHVNSVEWGFCNTLEAIASFGSWFARTTLCIRFFLKKSLSDDFLIYYILSETESSPSYFSVFSSPERSCGGRQRAISRFLLYSRSRARASFSICQVCIRRDLQRTPSHSFHCVILR